jgi:pyruvate dehydrogenase E2 component (dihydrolipoamide acetyltransferase)
LETDKATIEVPSSVSGVVKEIHMKAGDQANIGQLILTLETSGSQPAAAPAKAAPAPAPQPAAKPAEPAPAAKAEAPAPPPEPKPASAPAPEGPRKLAPAAPSVRRLARELGVIINEVPGAGPGGRISQKDVKAYVKQLNTQRREAPPASAATVGMPAQPELPDFSKWGEIERERMSAIRRATARAMSQAWTYIPHVTNFDSVDITELEKLRKLYAKKAEAAGGKLTVTAIIIKVLASALQRFPKFNASIDVANNEIIFKKYYNIGIAVDTERGLVVPSIRDVEKKNIIELAVELNEIAVKARDRKLTLEEMQGSTFTITNLGGIGGTNFTPIVNLPEVAILGVSRGRMEPVYRDGNFEPRLMMPLALSYDHRLVDGADAARFLRWVAEALEQPFLLALEG